MKKDIFFKNLQITSNFFGRIALEKRWSEERQCYFNSDKTSWSDNEHISEDVCYRARSYLDKVSYEVIEFFCDNFKDEHESLAKYVKKVEECKAYINSDDDDDSIDLDSITFDYIGFLLRVCYLVKFCAYFLKTNIDKKRIEDLVYKTVLKIGVCHTCCDLYEDYIYINNTLFLDIMCTDIEDEYDADNYCFESDFKNAYFYLNNLNHFCDKEISVAVARTLLSKDIDLLYTIFEDKADLINIINRKIDLLLNITSDESAIQEYIEQANLADTFYEGVYEDVLNEYLAELKTVIYFLNKDKVVYNEEFVADLFDKLKTFEKQNVTTAVTKRIILNN